MQHRSSSTKIEDALGKRADDPRLDGFADYYEAEIKPELEKFEKRRAGVFPFFLTIAIPILIVLFGLFLSLTVDGALILEAFCFIAAGAYYALSYALKKVIKDYVRFLAAKVGHFFGLTYSKIPDPSLLRWVERTKLMDTGLQTYTIDDEFSGEIGGLSVVIQEVLVHYKNNDDSFLIISTTFPKAFSGTTLIVHRDYIFDALGRIGDREQKIDLDNAEFNNMFNAYSTDQVECRYLLTPTFMERIVGLAHKHNGYFKVAFHQDRFVIVIDSWLPWFEGVRAKAELNHPTGTIEMLDDILKIHDLFADLKLAAKTKV